MNARRIALATLATLSLAAPSFAQSTQPSAAGLDKLRAKMTQAYAGGDVKAVLPYLDPEVVVVFPDGAIVRGRDALVAYVAGKTSGPDAIVEKYANAPEVQHRDLRGDAALSYGLMHDRYTLKDGRGELALDSRFTITAARNADGPADTDGWVIRSFHQSADAFDNPVLKMAAKKSMTFGAIAGGVAGIVIGAIAGVILGRRRTVAR